MPSRRAPASVLVLVLVFFSTLLVCGGREARADERARAVPKAEIEVTVICGSMPRDEALRAILRERAHLERLFRAIRERPAVITALVMVAPTGRGHLLGARATRVAAGRPLMVPAQLLLMAAFVRMRFPATAGGYTQLEVRFTLPAP